MENNVNKNRIDYKKVFKDLIQDTLLLSLEEYNKYFGTVERTIEQKSSNFYEDLLEREEYYHYIEKLLCGETNEFTYAHTDGQKILSYQKITKVELVKQIKENTNLSVSSLPTKVRQRYEKISESINLETFKESIIQSQYSKTVDNKSVVIPIKRIFSFIESTEEEYNAFLDTENKEPIEGVSKEVFIYMVTAFIKEHFILQNYMSDAKVMKRYKELISNERIDIQSINRITRIHDDFVSRITINEALKEAILKDMKEEWTSLEKAIYIYIKLCKTLTYDEEFYAMEQKGNIARKHEELANVSKITPTINNVVCYDFNVIYAAFLKELGLCFESSYRDAEKFGGGHASLMFRSGMYLVDVDPVLTVLKTDLMRAKINESLNGLKCWNQNRHTQKQFRKILNTVYSYVQEQEKKEQTVSFESALHIYENQYQNIMVIDLEEKLEMLIKKVRATKMIGIDAVAYSLYLFKMLFTETEQKTHIKMNIIRNNKPQNRTQEAEAILVFTVNKESLKEIPEQNQYFVYELRTALYKIEKEELEKRFASEELMYINDIDPFIPGIKIIGRLRR